MEKFVISTEKYVLVKKMFTNELIWVCHYEPESKRKSNEAETYWFFTGVAVKKIMLSLGHKMSYHYWFL